MRLFVLFSIGALWASSASADPAVEIPLDADAHAAAPAEIREDLWGEPRIRNVTRPTLTAYLPVSAKATGAAVIVAPGGGFQMLSIKSEGEDVARWLTDHGVAAFILKYPLNTTPKDIAAFQAEMAKLMKASEDSSARESLESSPGAQRAMAAGLTAVRVLRQRASEYHIDPHRVGFLGFSAGGIVALSVATSYDAASRPDFVASIYGSLPRGRSVPSDAPPLFLGVAADDPLLAHASAPVFDAWRAASHPAELHIFESGGHGFGLNRQGRSSDHWIDEYGWWLDSQGLLKTSAPTPAATAANSGQALPLAKPWSDARLSPDQRAALLNRELTFDERIALLHGPMALPFKPGVHIPAEAIQAAGYVPGIPRLGVPALYETDASLGVTNPMQIRPGDGATALPSGLALASTFSPALAFAGGAMIGSEARAKGFNVLLAGGVNLAREPRNGRNFEYLGEDPLLAGILAGESIRGIQSNHIISTAKHFALNDQETGRHVANELIGEAALRESDLLAFELAIEAGQPGAVMCAYNKLNGPYACGNDFLLNHVLKGNWHYPGWVMSDWGAVYATDFAAKGLDQESGEQLDEQVWFDAPLRAAVKSGAIPAARLEDMTRRILRSMFADGLFEFPVQRGDIDFAAHTEIARKEASEGIVLLQNRNHLLPLDSSVSRILIVGGSADLGTLSGGGSSQVIPPGLQSRNVVHVGGSGELAILANMVYQSSAPLEAIRARVPHANVTFDSGLYPSAAAASARHSDVVIVFANQWMTEGQDAPDLTLPAGQNELIQAVAAANPHTIVVLQTGGPVLMPWLSQSESVLEAWYSGAGGADAIADVLFGIVNPSGHLPMTFPKSVGRLPGFGLPDKQPFDVLHPVGSELGYRSAEQAALFPFGHGLSYTSFTYSDLQLATGSALTVSFKVRNTGEVKGKAVPQVYLTSAGGKRIKRLVGFAKVELAAGEEQRATVTIEPRLLASFDARRQRWHIIAGDYRFEVGSSSADLVQGGVARLSEAWRRP